MPYVSPFNAALLIQYILYHLYKTIALPSGEGASTAFTAEIPPAEGQ